MYQTSRKVLFHPFVVCSLAKELGLNGARADQLEDGITALHLLAGHEDQEASEVLEVCLRTADPNVRSSEGMSPVHVAALWGRLDNLKLLINHGGDLNQTDDEGQNVLDFASLSEGTSAKQCIKFILEVESNISLDESKTCIPEEKWDGMKHEQPVGEVSCEFSESFYTAIAEDSLLDQTVVTFPNLHPWFSADVSSGDLDETVVDKITELSISSNRYKLYNICYIHFWCLHAHVPSAIFHFLTLYTLTSVCIFSILFSTHFLKGLQGEFG